MKKLLSLILAVMMLAALVACGGDEDNSTSTTLVLDNNGVAMEYFIEADGDVVHTITQTSTLDLSAYTEDQIAMIEESVATYEATYSAIEGITYETEVTDTEFVEVIKIDASNEETLETLSAQGLMPIEGEGKISLSKTVESLKEQGWEEK